MKNLLNSVKLKRPNNNAFDLTHDVKLSLDMGWLVPTMCLEAVPGDRFRIGCDSLIRFAPMVAPIMHRVDVSMHYFFVPNRLLWEGWEDYITNTGSPLPAFPTYDLTTVTYTGSKLLDYLGLPDPVNPAYTFKVSALPFAAYQMIYNEYYRDQNLIPAVNYQLANGDNTALAGIATLRRRAWEHDYFTASLPFAQKGAAVNLPLGSVDYNPNGQPWLVKDVNGVLQPLDPSLGSDGTGDLASTNPGLPNRTLDPNGTLEIGATTINDLRRAFRLQEWLERQARGGTRYIESILAHFGVKSSDKRLNRPEYITGVKSPVIISEVLNTADTSATGAPQGNMAGHGVSVTQGRYGGYFCEEHGYIMGIMSIMPKTAYQQGIPKQFLKKDDPLQFYWPSFAHIGEQEVINAELYAPHATPFGTFGYLPRYCEYKVAQSRVAGDFKTSLDYWHLGRIFATDPNLNQNFVECVPDDRIFAVSAPNVDSIYAHILHKVGAVRPMPKFGTPTL